MTKLKIQIHDINTNEITERDMTDDEYAAYKLADDANNQRIAEAEAKALQRQALLSRLGISEEEARILLG
jgi:hypothetical protein